MKAKKVGTVADVMLQYEADYHPNSRSKLAFTYWIGMLKHSLRHLDLVITVSNFSKQAIEEFCARYRLLTPRIVVIYPAFFSFVSSAAADSALGQESSTTGKEDYVLHLASRLPYKGTRWLLQEWLEFCKRSYDLPRLLLVGDLDDRSRQLLAELDNVKFVPPLPRKELEEVIAKARALLLPSEIEGFGRAVVEGYLLGTPVAYAKGTALEEVVGKGSPGGFERDRDSLATALDEVLSIDATAVGEKRELFKRRYTSQECAQRTLEAYRSVLNF